MPTTDRAVVQIEKFSYSLAGLPIIEQQDRICQNRNAMIFALTTHARFKLASRCRIKPTEPDHALT